MHAKTVLAAALLLLFGLIGFGFAPRTHSQEAPQPGHLFFGGPETAVTLDGRPIAPPYLLIVQDGDGNELARTDVEPGAIWGIEIPVEGGITEVRFLLRLPERAAASGVTDPFPIEPAGQTAVTALAFRSSGGCGERTVMLSPGANLVGYTGERQGVWKAPAGLAPEQYGGALIYDAAGQRYLRNSPDLPPALNAWTALSPFTAMWILLDASAAPAAWTQQVSADAARSLPLQPDWNLELYSGPDGAAPEDAFASIRDTLNVAFTYDASDRSFQRYDPRLSGRLNTLTALNYGDAVLLHLARAATWTVPAAGLACDGETEPTGLRARLAEAMAGDLLQFELVALDVPAVARALAAGEVTLPVVDAEGRSADRALTVQPVQLRIADLQFGIFKSQAGDVQRVLLPREQNFILGDCLRADSHGERVTDAIDCGAVTIMDVEQTMLRAVIIDPDVGLSFLEPVDLVLGGRRYPGWHALYNIAGTVRTAFPEDEEPLSTPPLDLFRIPSQWLPLDGPGLRAQTHTLTAGATQIVLDGDAQFYNIDPATVWSRQESVHLIVHVIYNLFEPLSSNTWRLQMPIKGQEVWIAAGPTTTDGDALIAEITAPSYFLLTPITNDELHFLFVGYSVAGLYGKAAGIGDADGFGGAPGLNHAFGQARTALSYKTQWVVMAHEVGHLIGGRHGAGQTSGCSGGLFFSICGMSLMPAGSAGGPEVRAPYFSDANDANIVVVLNTLP